MYPMVYVPTQNASLTWRVSLVSLSFILLFGLGVLCWPTPVRGAKILGLFFFSTKSMRNIFDPLLIELGRRGHEITVVSPIPSSHNATNVRYITSPQDMDKAAREHPNMFETRVKREFVNPFTLFPFFEDLCRTHYKMAEVEQLRSQHFDLVIVNLLFNECVYGLAGHFSAPIVGVSPQSSVVWTSSAVGAPTPPSFVPIHMNELSHRMNFIERLENFYAYVWSYLWRRFYYAPKIENIYRDYYPNAASVYEFEKNIGAVLMNSDPTLNYPRPLLPNMIEIGGIHCVPSRPLSQNLEDFIQGSGEHGFIYFSMGSIVPGSSMPERYRKTILNTFSKLKQRVIWKWETETMDDLPQNVMLRKWLPQQDILGHPKIRLFITHGGLLSTEEAVFHGVPLIGIPMFSDQDLNMKQASIAGYALTMEFGDIADDILLNKINHILHTNTFSEKVKYFSKIFRDQISKPLDRAVFWVEYQLRWNGSTHLMSPARNLNFFQYHSIDVMALVFIGVATLLITLSAIFKRIPQIFRNTFGNRISSLKQTSKTTGNGGEAEISKKIK